MAAEVIIAGISAALQAMQTWLQYRDQAQTARAFDETYETQLTSPEVQSEAQRIADIIPREVLDDMQSRTYECWRRFRATLNDKSLLQDEVDNAMTTLQRCICSEIARIHLLNRGVISDGKLREWWVSYCEHRAPGSKDFMSMSGKAEDTKFRTGSA